MTLVHNIFGHVLAHIGSEGNKRAFALAKAATENPTNVFRVPLFHVKRILKERVVHAW